MPALLISIDVSVMILALPHISVSLGADSVQQLWIMDIYGFLQFVLVIAIVAATRLRCVLPIGRKTTGSE